MKKFVKKCLDCGFERNRNQRIVSDYCPSCAAKRRIKKYGNNKNFLKYCQKGYCSKENNPFYGKKHTKESKIKMLKNTNRDFMKTKEYKQKQSKQCSGSGNPMYGRSYYDVWLSKYGKEKADLLMQQKKDKHKISSSGKNNPMYGKESPKGSGNGWSGWYKNWYFRSLKELSYVVNVLEPNGLKWKSAENIRIKYQDWSGSDRTYGPDFLVEDKLLVEVKPKKLHSSVSVLSKQSAAEKFAESKGWKYQIIDPPPISTEQIDNLHKNKQILFTDKYETKYKKLKNYNCL